PAPADAELCFLALCLRLLVFFLGVSLPLAASVPADWPDVADGEVDELLVPPVAPVEPVEPVEPVAPVEPLPMLDEPLEPEPVAPELLPPLLEPEEPEEPDEPDVSDEPDEPDDDGMVDFEEPLAAPVAASLLGLLVPLADGVDELEVPPEVDPLEPDDCASTTDDADAIRTNDSARSVDLIVMSHSLNCWKSITDAALWMQRSQARSQDENRRRAADR
ncbi:hypothetical protein E4K72_17250, partial [Oxalobacteraceae bacterium OM1]